MAWTPVKRIRRAADVPSPARSTSIVSPSLTDTTFAVQTSQRGTGWPATQAPRLASARAGSTASAARTVSKSRRRRRTTKRNPVGTSEVAAPSMRGAAAQGALHLADRPHDGPRRAPAQVALPAGRTLHDPPVAGHGEHEVLPPAPPEDAALRTEAGDDDHGPDLPHARRERRPGGPRGGGDAAGRGEHRADAAGPVDELRRDVGGRPVLLLRGALLEQQLQRAALGERRGRVRTAPEQAVAVARELQPLQLGAQAHLGDRTGRHAGRPHLRA